MSSNWSNTLPADVSKIRISAGLIRNNWGAIDNGTTGTGYGFCRNHVTMTDGTNGGLHYRVDYYQAVSSPTLAGVSSAYARAVAYSYVSGTPTWNELYYKTSNTGGPPSTVDIPITNSTLQAMQGEGMLPGGLFIKTGTGTGNNPVTYTTPFPTAALSVILTAIGNNPAISNSIPPGPLLRTGFTANGTAFNPSFYWIAIGY